VRPLTSTLEDAYLEAVGRGPAAAGGPDEAPDARSPVIAREPGALGGKGQPAADEAAR
jgi:hypothetical protein